MCSSRSAQARRILIVDDEPAIADTLAIILKRSGYEVRAVYSAEEALRAVHSWPPDLLLSDVVMPGMNGIDAAVLISQVLPSCRVLLISGQAEVHDLMQSARARGFYFDLIAKPVHPLDLLSRIAA